MLPRKLESSQIKAFAMALLVKFTLIISGCSLTNPVIGEGPKLKCPSDIPGALASNILAGFSKAAFIAASYGDQNIVADSSTGELIEADGVPVVVSKNGELFQVLGDGTLIRWELVNGRPLNCTEVLLDQPNPTPTL